MKGASAGQNARVRRLVCVLVFCMQSQVVIASKPKYQALFVFNKDSVLFRCRLRICRLVKLKPNQASFNPFSSPNGISKPYKLNVSISNLRVVGW